MIISGTTVKNVIFSTFRSLLVDDDGRLQVDVVRNGGEAVLPFLPVDGGGQHVDIGAGALRSTALTVDKIYHITAESDCYIVSGDNSVVVTTSDYFLPANLTIIYVPTTGQDYISVIQKAVAVANGLHICQASA